MPWHHFLGVIKSFGGAFDRFKKGNLKYQKCAMASLFRGFRKV